MRRAKRPQFGSIEQFEADELDIPTFTRMAGDLCRKIEHIDLVIGLHEGIDSRFQNFRDLGTIGQNRG